MKTFLPFLSPKWKKDRSNSIFLMNYKIFHRTDFCISDNRVWKSSPKGRQPAPQSPKTKKVLFFQKIFSSKKFTGHVERKVVKVEENFRQNEKKICSNSRRLEIFFLFRFCFFLNEFDWTHRKLFDNPAQKSFSTS